MQSTHIHTRQAPINYTVIIIMDRHKIYNFMYKTLRAGKCIDIMASATL